MGARDFGTDSFRTARLVRWRRLCLPAVVFGTVLSVLSANPAGAFVFVNPAPSFPDTVTVGQTLPAALGINNSSTPPESTTNPVLSISAIDLYPACTTTAVDCAGGTAEAGVFALSATGTGSPIGAGVTGCSGTWTIVPDTGNPATATRYRFIPPGGEGSLQLPTGTTCVVTFTAKTLRVPTVDLNAALPNFQTNQVASSTATGPTIPPVRAFALDQTTVLQAFPGLATTAASTPAQPAVGGTLPSVPATTTDTATLNPPPPSGTFGAPPTGTITFNLYGPFPAGTTPSCTGGALDTQQVPVNGPGPYATPTAVNITSAGTYTWVATYSGDANYVGSPNGCGDASETVAFVNRTPTTADDCSNGGWRNVTGANGASFKNQGDCVSYAATGGKNPPAGG